MSAGLAIKNPNLSALAGARGSIPMPRSHLGPLQVDFNEVNLA